MDKRLRAIITTALLSALALALYLLEFPLFPAAGHLKLDFSDIPALLGAMMFGPGTGVVIELIKNLIEMMIKGIGTQMGFGNLMNFAVGVAFVLPYALVYRRGRKRAGVRINWQTLTLAGAAGMIALVAVGIGMNFIVTPLFFRFFLDTELPPGAVMGVVWYATALNAIKGAILCAAGALMAQPPLQKALGRLDTFS